AKSPLRLARPEMLNDVRHAYRSLRRSRRTTIVAIVLFAVTLGVTAAIYAVVDAELLRPSAMRTPARTVVVWQRDEGRGSAVVEISYDEAVRWRENARSLDALGVFSSVTWPLSLIEGEARTRVSFVAVSPSFFDVAGVMPARGRVLNVRDEAASEPRVAVLSDRLWRHRFAADPRVIGRLIRVRAGLESPDLTLEIVGVMSPDF